MDEEIVKYDKTSEETPISQGQMLTNVTAEEK